MHRKRQKERRNRLSARNWTRLNRKSRSLQKRKKTAKTADRTARLAGKREKKLLEIDFIANKGDKKYYIQSAFEMTSPEKIVQEKKSLTKLNDFFKKIIVVKDDIKPNTDEQGIITVGIFDFLLNDNILEQI